MVVFVESAKVRTGTAAQRSGGRALRGRGRMDSARQAAQTFNLGGIVAGYVFVFVYADNVTRCDNRAAPWKSVVLGTCVAYPD